MRCFHGSDGEVFALSRPYRFHDVPMEDCGGGFDWRISDRALSCWCPDVQPTFALAVGERREELLPVEMYPQTGRVGFGRCLEGQLVRASGVCYPVALLATTSSWEVNIDILISNRPQLSAEGPVAVAEVGDATAVLRGVDPEVLREQQVLTRLWLAQSGALVGRGEVRNGTSPALIQYDEKGVTYELC